MQRVNKSIIQLCACKHSSTLWSSVQWKGGKKVWNLLWQPKASSELDVNCTLATLQYMIYRRFLLFSGCHIEVVGHTVLTFLVCADPTQEGRGSGFWENGQLRSVQHGLMSGRGNSTEQTEQWGVLEGQVASSWYWFVPVLNWLNRCMGFHDWLLISRECHQPKALMKPLLLAVTPPRYSHLNWKQGESKGCLHGRVRLFVGVLRSRGRSSWILITFVVAIECTQADFIEYLTTKQAVKNNFSLISSSVPSRNRWMNNIRRMNFPQAQRNNSNLGCQFVFASCETIHMKKVCVCVCTCCVCTSKEIS